MQQYQLSESIRNAINSRVGETFRLLKEAAQKLVDRQGNPLTNTEKYAVIIEALQFIIRNRDPNIDAPQNYIKGHQLLSDVDVHLESIYDNPTTFDENLQGQTIIDSVQLYVRTLIRACIANIEADFSVILREVNNKFPSQTTDEKKNVSDIPANKQVDASSNVASNLVTQNALPTTAAIVSALPPAMAAASSSSSTQIMGMNPTYDYLCRIHLIGANGAGKTSIYKCYEGQAFNLTYVPTYKYDFITKSLTMADKEIKLLIVDAPLRNLELDNRRSPDCLIYVIDVTDRKAFEQLLGLIKHQPLYLPALLAVTKCDLNERRVISANEIQKLAFALGIKEIIEVSAKTGHNIPYLFERAAFFSMDYLRNKGNFDSSSYEEDVMKRLDNYQKNTSSRFFSNNQNNQAAAVASSSSSSAFWSSAQNPSYDYHFKIKFCGDRGVGKTSIVQTGVNKSSNNSGEGTSFVGERSKYLVAGDKKISVKLYDWPTHYRQTAERILYSAHATVIVFDMTNRSSFKYIDDHARDAYSVTVLVGTHNDSAQKVIVEEEVNRKAKELGINHIMFVNGKTGENVENLIREVVTLICHNKNINLLQQNENPEPPSSKCVIC